MKKTDKQLLQQLLLLSYPDVAIDTLKGCVSAGLDEERLRWLINRHRAWNLVAFNIKKLEPSYFSVEFHRWLEDANSRCKQQTLLQFMVQSRLAKKLNDIGVKHRFFKGIDLSLRLYGDLNRRFSRDIDLLVSESDALKAEQALFSYGYSAYDGAFGDDDIGGVISTSFYKDKGYHAKGLPMLELHIRINDEKTSFSDAVSESLLRNGLEQSQKVNTLEYVYLCTHAMKSNCHRIKWLVDLAAYQKILDEVIPGWREQRWCLAKEYGVTRSVLTCEYLLSTNFEIPMTERRFIGLKIYSSWIRHNWLYDLKSSASLKHLVFPILLNGNFHHWKLAISRLLFCPNPADKIFLNRYTKDDAKYLRLLLPIRKLVRYARLILRRAHEPRTMINRNCSK